MLSLDVQNSYRARYRKLRPGWRPSGELIEALVRARLTPQSRVLDLGCGRGGVVELFWHEVGFAAGIDADAASLAEHRAAGMPVLQGRGESLPFVDESFDLVVCLWVLEHLRRPDVVLREVRRVLRPGGHFIFLTPNLKHPLLRLNRVSRALPQLQRKLVPRLYGRAEADTFPVQYRANTTAALKELASAADLEVSELRAVPDPTYVALNAALFRASVWSERWLPAGWGIHLVGDFARAGALVETEPALVR